MNNPSFIGYSPINVWHKKVVPPRSNPSGPILRNPISTTDDAAKYELIYLRFVLYYIRQGYTTIGSIQYCMYMNPFKMQFIVVLLLTRGCAMGARERARTVKMQPSASETNSRLYNVVQTCNRSRV